MAGYVRQSAADIVPTGVVRAAPINNELNALRDAFVANGGHRHDGTAAEGHPVPVVGDADLLNKIATDTANNRHGVFVEVAAAAVEQVRFQDGAIVPVTDNDIDLGTSALEFKDLYIDGTANIDSLVADTADINGGTVDAAVVGATTPAAGTFTTLTANTSLVAATADINGGTVDGAVIGGSSALAITGTTVTATTGFVGGLTGAVTGNTAGTHTGAVVGNVTGNLTGNVTASTGTSTFNDVTINGGLNMDAATAATITNLTSPTNTGDAATKGYVDTADALKLNLSGGTMSGAIAMGTNKITGLGTPTLSADATTKTYVDTADALKLNLAGGTMSGAIAMGTSKITGLGDPTLAQDAATKTYVDTSISNLVAAAPGALDTLDELAAALGDDANFATTVTNSIATKLALAGGTMSGAIAMGTNKITGVGNPTLAQDAATKTYVDTADALKLNLSGGTMSGAIAMGTSQITGLGNPTLAQDAATKTYVDTADALKLNLAGGTMSGAIAMGTSKITGMGDPTANQDAATKVYVDTADALKLSLTGGTMSGAIAMGTSKITGLGDPTANQDAATKVYVDGILGSSTAAAASASAAATSASNAATSASNASTSASNASSSASAASTSATNAANSYDAFDDRYLGSKASAPSVDNDGNTLLVGALYWNSTSNELYLWTGSVWTQAAFTASGFATLTGAETLTNKTLTSPILTTPQLGTPSSGTVTNLTGTASININGTVGATTATTGAFTTLSATGVATFSAGTAALPALTTTGDTNTGIFFPAADTMAFVEGGAEALRITSAGNVSIGNPTTTEAKLKIATTNGASDFSASGINICGAAEITSGQVLPISFTPIGSDSNRARAAIGCITGTNWGFGNLGFYTRAAADGTLLTTADERMRITSGGDVGIGTSSPTAKLTVAGVSNTGYTSFLANGTGTAYNLWTMNNTGGDIRIGIESSTAVGILTGSTNYSACIGTLTANSLHLGTNSTVRATIDSSGNVGIGTSSPTTKLQINGATFSNNSTNSAFLTAGSQYYGSIANTSGANTYSLGYSTNGTTHSSILYWNADGNLGLGVTPSAWYAPNNYRAVQVGQSSFVGRITAGAEYTQILSNVFVNTSAAYKYINNGTATIFEMINGEFRWLTAASGIAGDTVSLTQAMTLDASGNLLLGGTSSGSSAIELQQDGDVIARRLLIAPASGDGNVYFNSANNAISNIYMGGITNFQYGFIKYDDNTDYMAFGTNNAERARITSGGNLLLGLTTGAVTQFTMSGDLSHRDNVGGVFAISNYENAALTFSTNTSGGGGERMRISSAGLVGIGNSAPNAPLDVRGDTGTSVSAVMRIRGTNTTARTTRLQFEDYAGTIADALIDFKIPTAGSAASALFQLGINGPIITMDVNGKVGIGNTAPTGNLHIGNGSTVGDQDLYVQSDAANRPRLRLWGGTSNGYQEFSNGSTSPLYVGFGATLVTGLSASDAALRYATFLVFSSGATERARLSNAGGFSVGTTSDPGAGAIYATGNITAFFSDKRLKTVSGKIENALDKVAKLSGVYYTFNDTAKSYGYDSDEEHVGVIAQEVEAVLPQIVKAAPFDLDENNNSKSGENYKTVQYEKLVPLLIEAINELQAKVKVLEAK